MKNHYQFDGLYNFRDIGGLETEDGRNMRTGLLYRSDELSRLSGQDLEQMHQLGIRLVCDLRTPKEQQSKPSKLLNREGIKVVTFSVFDQSQEYSRFEFFKFLAGKSVHINFEQIMTDLYHTLAFSSGNEIKGIISLLADQNNLPALIHCTGGKDRTGFTAAIIQLLCGVPYEKVMDHYLFSNEVIAPRMKKIEMYIRWMSLFRVKPDKIKPVLEVRREYLHVAYEEIIRQYGDIENYLASVCELDREVMMKLRSMLVE